MDKKEFFMNKKVLLAMLAVALVFGMTACKEGEVKYGGISKIIKITGFPDEGDGADVLLSSTPITDVDALIADKLPIYEKNKNVIAYGGGSNASGNVYASMYDNDNSGNRFHGSGQYYVILIGYGFTHELVPQPYKLFITGAGKTSLVKIDILESGTGQTEIPFSEFVEFTDW
jgi:hypothetical protein